jgi:hypothetical protein
VRHRHSLFGLQRHHCGDHARAQPLDIVAMTDNSDRKRGAADILDQQSQIDHFADPARNLEVAFDAGAYQIRVSDQSQNG